MINLIEKLATKNIFLVCGTLLTISFFSCMFWVTCLHILQPPDIGGLSSNTDQSNLLNWLDIGITIPISATIEEIVFRLFPALIWVATVADFTINKKKEDIILVSIMIISSILFGWLHGNIYNIVLQGISGFIFFMTFLIGYFKVNEKNKGNVVKGIIMGTITSSVCHMTFNWNIVILSFLL